MPPTKLYLRDTMFYDTASRDARTAAGSALVASDATPTEAGPVSGVHIVKGTATQWISPPLNAVSVSGTLTFNVWMSESNMSANVGPHVRVRQYDNALGIKATLASSEKGTELPTTTRAAQNWTVAPTAVDIADFDRIGIEVMGNDIGTMAVGHTFDLGYNGGTGGSDGDSWVQLAETITEKTILVETFATSNDEGDTITIHVHYDQATGIVVGVVLDNDYAGADFELRIVTPPLEDWVISSAPLAFSAELATVLEYKIDGPGGEGVTLRAL